MNGHVSVDDAQTRRSAQVPTRHSPIPLRSRGGPARSPGPRYAGGRSCDRPVARRVTRRRPCIGVDYLENDVGQGSGRSRCAESVIWRLDRYGLYPDAGNEPATGDATVDDAASDGSASVAERSCISCITAMRLDRMDSMHALRVAGRRPMARGARAGQSSSVLASTCTYAPHRRIRRGATTSTRLDAEATPSARPVGDWRLHHVCR